MNFAIVLRVRIKRIDFIDIFLISRPKKKKKKKHVVGTH